MPTEIITRITRNHGYTSVNQGVPSIEVPATRNPSTVGSFLPTVSKINPMNMSKEITKS